MSNTYASAGVNIDAGEQAVHKITRAVKSTHSPAVLTDIGGFGGAFSLCDILKSYTDPVLVQSTDSVGTKVMIAGMMNKYDTIGRDLVGNVVGDILVMGATPLTFLDYLAYNQIDPDRIEQIVKGIAEECVESGMALIGGEMAELPGVYQKNETDIVGFVTGVVEREKMITGKTIVPGDVVFGLASSGIHTNGLSLARKIFFDIGQYTCDDDIPELEKSVGKTLLETHCNYTKPIRAILDAGIDVKGMAHITGGGLIENIPRILPTGCAVELRKGSWPVHSVFDVMQRIGDVTDAEMYRTFNMGIGLVLIVDKDQRTKIKEQLSKHPNFSLFEIGTVTSGKKSVQIC